MPGGHHGLRRLLGGVAWIGISGVCARSVAFAASIALAHTLGPADFGVLAFGLSVAVVFSACASLGLDELIVREVARQTRASGAIFADALVLRLCAVPLGVGGALLLASIYHIDLGLSLVLASYAVLNSYLLSACAAFRGRGRMHVHALLIGGQALLISASATLLALLTGAVGTVTAAYAASTGAIVVAAYCLLSWTGAQPRFGWRPRAWLSLARSSAPFALGGIGLLALDRLALSAITLVCGPQAAGWFGAAQAIVLALSGAATTATLVAFPHLARAVVHDPRAASVLAVDLLALALVLGVASCIGLYFLAPVLVPMLFGPEYVASTAIMQRIAFSVPSIFVTIVLVGAFEATDRQSISAVTIAAAVPVAAVLCMGATWLWGYTGGAAAYSASHAVLAAMLLARWFVPPGSVRWTNRVLVVD